jgi:hypothetical protein
MQVATKMEAVMATPRAAEPRATKAVGPPRGRMMRVLNRLLMRCWMRHGMHCCVSVLVLLASVAPGARAAPGPYFERVELAGHYWFPVYANHALAGDLSAIERVVFVFHGLQRDGDAYFEAANTLAGRAHVDAARTLIIAPNFFDGEDQRRRDDLQDLPLWKGTGWMEGDAAVVGPTVSSFQVIDDLIARLADPARLPALRRIVIAGHSGGGQLVDRYAALNHADQRLKARGIEVAYVIANPSSYLYFTADRPEGDGFAPYSTALCPNYDHYRYGMQDLVPYAGGVTGMAAFAAFAGRDVTFLWGTDDTDPRHPALDKSCGAEAEGPSRYVRGHAYWTYEHRLAGHDAIPMHHAFDVTGVGHNQARMLGSECASILLFGPDAHDESAAACVAVKAEP